MKTKANQESLLFVSWKYENKREKNQKKELGK